MWTKFVREKMTNTKLRIMSRIGVLLMLFFLLVFLLFYIDQLVVGVMLVHRSSFLSHSNRTLVVLGWVRHNFEAAMTSSKHMDGWFHLPLAKSKTFAGCYLGGYLDRDMYPCVYTTNFDLYNQSDGVLFRGIQLHNIEIPKYRIPGQKWIFVEHEPPPALWRPYFIQLQHFNNMFNLTATFTSDADIQRQDFAKKCVKDPQKLHKLRDKDYRYKKTNTSLAAILVSNCKSQSKREEYVKELQEYMKVDVYGKCGDLKCGDRLSWYNDNCTRQLLHEKNSYMFYLAFENSLCEEYVTEKIWKVLNLDVVPVVMGAADYESMLPPDTYINAKDFRSPKALAEYLRYLSETPRRYNRYIQNKNSLKCVDVQGPVPWECRLCKTLHDLRYTEKIVPNLAEFWGQSRCTTFDKLQHVNMGY